MLGDPRNRTLLLVMLAIGLLGTVVLFLLCGFLRDRRFARLRRRLLHRVRLWWIMGFVLVIAASVGKNGSVIVFGLTSFLLLRELITITPTRRGDHLSLLLSFFVVLPLHYLILASNWYGLFVIFIPTYVFLLLPIVAAMRGDANGFLERTAKIQWALMIGVYCVSYVPALLRLSLTESRGAALGLLVYLVVVVQANDVARFVVDEMARPRGEVRDGPEQIRWTGLVAGLCAAIAAGLSLHWTATPFTAVQSVAMSATVGLLATGGTRFAVILHRDQDAASQALVYREPGIMDHLASLCFAAPIFFHLTRYYWGAPSPDGLF
jgi:phosphatidate cytidylyltransferase